MHKNVGSEKVEWKWNDGIMLVDETVEEYSMRHRCKQLPCYRKPWNAVILQQITTCLYGTSFSWTSHGEINTQNLKIQHCHTKTKHHTISLMSILIIFSYFLDRVKQTGVAVALYTFINEAPGSNFSLATCYPGWELSWFYSVFPGEWQDSTFKYVFLPDPYLYSSGSYSNVIRRYVTPCNRNDVVK